MKPQPTFKPFRLTPVDHTLPKVYIFKSLYFRSVDTTSSLSRLQSGIDILVSRLPFISGEVAPCDDLVNKTGVLQVEMSGPSLQEMPMLLVKSFPGRPWPERRNMSILLDESYHPLPGVIPKSHARPVVRFQANLLPDGLVLCMGYNHSVFDGTGAGTILEMLADCCRDGPEGIISLPITGELEDHLRQRLLDAAVENPPREPYDMHCADTEMPVGDEGCPAMFPTCAFLLSPERIDSLRDACNTLLGHLESAGTGSESQETPYYSDARRPKYVSSNDVLTALLAVSVERAREIVGAQERESNSLAMAVDLRGRLKSMPKNYLGNLVTTVWASYHRPRESDPSGILQMIPKLNRPNIGDDDLLWIASVAIRIRLGLEAIDEKHIRGLVHYLQEKEDWAHFGIHFTDPIFISSWRHLKVYDLEFGPGLGKIEQFEMNVGNTDGLCVVMPANRRVGKNEHKPLWDIRFILNPEVMEALTSQDSPFAWAMLTGGSSS